MCGFSASLIKAGNSGILCETRRGVLPESERTLVRDRTGMVLTTPYRAKLRIAGCQFLRKVGNSGILCETRREVLRTRERTSVRDQVLRFSQRRIARNYALPTVNSCERQAIAEFCARQGVRFCPRGSVRWYVTERAWFSQRSITQNYALPDISRCLRERRCSSPQCIPHHCRAERRRHPAEPEPARQLPCRPSRRSHRT